MNEDYRRALSIFTPNILDRAEFVRTKNLKFVQYTSAEAALSIIKNQQVWLRNTQCMNDFMEVEHGRRCLTNTFTNDKEGKEFKDCLEKLLPGIIQELVELFDSWLPSLQKETYISCVSEHPHKEDKYGRLSMWRAYGNSTSVAIVLNTKPFLSESNIFQAFTSPVNYLDPEDFNVEFSKLTERIKADQEFIKSLGKNKVINYLLQTFKSAVLCTKHPGFEEEREWRVVYNPVLAKSEYVKTSIETIGGIPQYIHKIPLKDIPEGDFFGAEIPDFFDKIIIGPNEHQDVLAKAFATVLEQAGCKSPYSKITYSGIPLR